MSQAEFFLTAFLLYVAVYCLAVAVTSAVRMKAWPVVVILTACALLAFLAGYDGRVKFATLAAEISILSLILTYVALGSRMSWRDKKATREVGRKTIIHLILATGSAAFIMPFAWLVVTSLKEDEDMSHFPP